MQYQLVVLFLLLCVYSSDSASCTCKKFENVIYQATSTLPGLQSFLGLLTMLPNGIFFQTNNIANGNNAAEIGFNVAANSFTGYYDCSSNNTVHIIGIGYVYPTNDVAALKDNGGVVVLDYNLEFLNNDNRQCNGTLRFAFYQIGSNPFNSSNIPFNTSPTATVTCQFLSGRNFHLPPSTS